MRSVLYNKAVDSCEFPIYLYMVFMNKLFGYSWSILMYDRYADGSIMHTDSLPAASTNHLRI